MSVPTVKQSFAFLNPLRGKSSAFIVTNRGANATVARFTLHCLAVAKIRTIILDTSCFYAMNVRSLTHGLPNEFIDRTTIIGIPEETTPEDVITDLLTTDAKAILIDDLNALNALLSSGQSKSAIHKLFVTIRVLSYNARMDNSLVFTTVYGTQRADGNSRRSLAASADLQISVESRPSHISFRCNNAWPSPSFDASVGWST